MSETLRLLNDNYERMAKAVVSLKELRDGSIYDRTRIRLNGKIEGVELAMGYLWEAIREERRAADWDRKFEEAAKAEF